MDKAGHTPLTIAALGGHVKYVEELLEYGANKDDGKTALSIANERSFPEIVQLFETEYK